MDGIIQTLPKFLPFIKFLLRSGTNINFRNDCWIDKAPSKSCSIVSPDQSKNKLSDPIIFSSSQQNVTFTLGGIWGKMKLAKSHLYCPFNVSLSPISQTLGFALGHFLVLYFYQALSSFFRQASRLSFKFFRPWASFPHKRVWYSLALPKG